MKTYKNESSVCCTVPFIRFRRCDRGKSPVWVFVVSGIVWKDFSPGDLQSRSLPPGRHHLGSVLGDTLRRRKNDNKIYLGCTPYAGLDVRGSSSAMYWYTRLMGRTPTILPSSYERDSDLYSTCWRVSRLADFSRYVASPNLNSGVLQIFCLERTRNLMVQSSFCIGTM